MKEGIKRIWNLLRELAAYYLGAKLMAFGIPKLLAMQFRVPDEIWSTPLGELSPYWHMWSFFGRSYGYNAFIGIAEVLIGALLIFRKTRLAALVLASGLYLNLLALNFSFDLTFARGHTLFDMGLLLILLWPYRKRLVQFFFVEGGMPVAGAATRRKALKLLPWLFVGLFGLGYFLFSLYIRHKYGDL